MTLDVQIAGLGMADDLASALRGAVATRAVETHREGGYIAVRPIGRHIAAYFNKAFVDVAVEPDQSARTSARCPGTSVLPKSTATHYVRVPATTVAVADIIELVALAVDWRERGHRWSGEWSDGRSAELAGEVCATCYLAIAANGSCGCE